MLIFMETHLTSCGDLRLFITGILEVEGGELIVSSALSTLELELLGRGILLVCVGILYVLLLISDLYLVGLAPCHFEDFLKKIMFEVGKFSLQLERSGDWGDAGRAYKCSLADREMWQWALLVSRYTLHTSHCQTLKQNCGKLPSRRLITVYSKAGTEYIGRSLVGILD